uniref:Uncharacterized protein n=1 Tax=viral metagenome TaxID=1070528 RepID=A0A6M3L9M5_9ZZZZ
MKSQILTTEKEQWLILTPENDFEEKILKMFEGMPNVWRGEFRQCEGGYMRSWNESCGHKDDLIIKFANINLK